MAWQRDPMYDTWRDMNRRCYDPRASSYKRYGAKGITVCDEWRASFHAFLRDMGPKPEPGFQIDRIDPFGNYEPSNCRWASRTEQCRNWRTRNRIITFNGQSKTLAEWCEQLGVDRCLVRDRLDHYGWSVEDALTTPKTNKHARKKLKQSAAIVNQVGV